VDEFAITLIKDSVIAAAAMIGDRRKAEVRDFSITNPIYRRKGTSRRTCRWLAEGSRT
jgi:hypothetical protein